MSKKMVKKVMPLSRDLAVIFGSIAMVVKFGGVVVIVLRFTSVWGDRVPNIKVGTGII